MPREKIAAKYLGDGSEYHNGIPSRDITESEFERLSDDQKALLAESKLYTVRHTAPAETASKGASKSEPTVTIGGSGSGHTTTATAVIEAAPASKDDGKK